MKMLKNEQQKICWAALMLGVFTVSWNVALAEGEEETFAPATRDGMRMTDLRAVSPNFSIRLDGNNVIFEGRMPKKCAKDRLLEYSTQPMIENKPGRHAFKFKMPGCDGQSLSAADKKDLIYVRDAFPPRTIETGIDGPICILSSEDGPEKCDSVAGPDGKPVSFQSQATRDRIAGEASARREADARKKKEDELVAKLGLLCRTGDFSGFQAELEAAKLAGVLGDISRFLEQMKAVKQRFFEEQIKKAKNEEDLRAAYENFLQAAEENGWDTEKVTEAYVTRRVDLVKELVSGEGTPATKARAISALASELRELDAYRGNKGQVAWLFAQLATNLRDAEKFDEAETYFQRAIDHAASQEDKVKIESEMAKMFLDAHKACLEKNKLSPGKCDRLAQKAKKHMDGAIALQGKRKGDDALEDLMAMRAERIQAFGYDGTVMKVQGYGVFNPYGGQVDAAKMQTYQMGMQEAMMQYQMRARMGGGMPGAGSDRSFFR